jgi:hypothetical protein
MPLLQIEVNKFARDGKTACRATLARNLDAAARHEATTNCSRSHKELRLGCFAQLFKDGARAAKPRHSRMSKTCGTSGATWRFALDQGPLRAFAVAHARLVISCSQLDCIASMMRINVCPRLDYTCCTES